MRTRYLFNPELNSRWFSIPGIVVVIMGILCSLLTTLTVANEWENGSMELLLSTPVKPIEIIIGKLIPYAAICLGSVIMVFVLARLWFDVPFVGSHLIFWGGCFIFLAGYLAFGLLISVLIREQLPAMQAGIIAGMLPTTLLSGFIYPIANMPEVFQKLTMFLPARWFMIISREQFLKGSDLYSLFVPLVSLMILTIFFIVLAVKMFKKDLEI
jgi:ABC-2 type transport system permease protein